MSGEVIKRLPKWTAGVLGGVGFPCPHCGGRSAVIDTRKILDGIRRRRGCVACGRRWSTYETAGPSGDYRRKLVAMRRQLAEAIRLIDELTEGEQEHGSSQAV